MIFESSFGQTQDSAHRHSKEVENYRSSGKSLIFREPLFGASSGSGGDGIRMDVNQLIHAGTSARRTVRVGGGGGRSPCLLAANAIVSPCRLLAASRRTTHPHTIRYVWNRVLRLVSVFFVLFLLPLKAQSPLSEDLLAKARARLEAEEYAAAHELVREVLRAQPDDVEASFLLGVLLAEQESWEAAGQTLERAIDLSPRFAQAHLELAGVRYRQGANHEAMRLLRRTISMDPGNSHARYFLATLSYLDERQLKALYHWNAVGEPRINEISYLTPSQTNPELIGKLFRLNEGEVLRREQIMDIRWVREKVEAPIGLPLVSRTLIKRPVGSGSVVVSRELFALQEQALARSS